MQYTEGGLGRVFVLRLEDGEILPDAIDDFARKKGIQLGSIFLIGGMRRGQIVVGPRDSVKLPPEPVLFALDDAHEIIGVGFIAPDKDGVPRMHMHAALGRAGQTRTGCVRPGIETWHVGEAVIYEILDAKAARLPDERTGFELLQAEPSQGKHNG